MFTARHCTEHVIAVGVTDHSVFTVILFVGCGFTIVAVLCSARFFLLMSWCVVV